MYHTSLWEDIKWFFGKYKEEDTTAWLPYREKMIQYINKDILDSKQQLPKGTKLYHGTLNDDFKPENLKDKITFTGLEPVISMWYTLEESLTQSKSLYFGYVYEFELIKPIHVDNIIKYLSKNPLEDDKCKKYGPVCIHPQVTFHGSCRNPPYDLSIELTLPLKQLYKDGFFKINQEV